MHLPIRLSYCLPIFLTGILIGMAYVDSSWVFAMLLFAATAINKRWGRFSAKELSREYLFFHRSRIMVLYKSILGAFFVLFNVWTAFFCIYHSFTFFPFVTFIYSVIVVNSSFGLSLAHELTHEKRPFQRWLGDVLMLQNGFFYLAYDHVFIHHQHVGTLGDPASALLNENLYAYLRRSLIGRMKMIFTAVNTPQTNRERRLYRAVRWKFALCMSWLILSFIISKILFIMIASQYIFVILVYETITYIQHYGLRRPQQERVSLDHSWNSFDRFYNYLYFFMPVHSLHHANMWPEESAQYSGPAMPLSFPRMLMLAFRPPRWFKIMNPLVKQVESRQCFAKTGR